MNKGLLFFIFVSSLSADTPIIKIKGETLLQALAYTESSSYEKLYNWNIGSKDVSPVTWDSNGNNWTPNGFERKGKVYLTNNGKITHTIVDKEKQPGYWNLFMVGDKDKITEVTVSPNKVTNENPTILIDKAFIKKEIVCEENKILKKSTYQIKFPKKVSFWMIEKKNISPNGEESVYTITYDKKPDCAINATDNQKSSTIDSDTKKEIQLFLKSYYKAEEKEFPSKSLAFYNSSLEQYFSEYRVSKEEILKSKITFFKKWTTRKFEVKDIEIIDSSVMEGIHYYTVNTVIKTQLQATDGIKKESTDYNILKLIGKKEGYAIHSIKTINSSTPKSSSSSKLTNKNEGEQSSKIKNISFSENGIDIYLTYPTSVYFGKKFEIKAEMTNKNKDAKQGGLTLSFPDMESMTGTILKNNFASLKGYSYPNKIFNKDTRKTMKTEYYMVEGWQNKKWLHNQKKYFTIELKAPKNLSELSVNLRGVLWIKNKHDLKEIPLQSIIKDQQGFAVKQFSINIVQKDEKSKKSIPLKQGMPYSQARKALLNSGWQATSTRWQDIPEYGRENDFYYKNGWKEVESCSGTGLGYCLFNFHDADGHTLSVVTAGEDNDPSVDNWSRK